MTTTVDFDANPRAVNIAVGGTSQVRLVDKSTTTDGVITNWVWIFYDSKAWTVTAPPSTRLNLAGANTYFAVGDQICLYSDAGAASLPAGLSPSPTTYYVVTATSTYLEVSATLGGAAITYTSSGAGDLYVQHASTLQNAIIPIRNRVAGPYGVTLSCKPSGSASYTSLHRNAWFPVNTTTYAKPTTGGLFGRISIFIYDSTNATVINRVKSTNNNLFFSALKVTGYMNKAGQAIFTVYNSGGATATEIGLMVADKNVAIISGREVIWTGKIARATQEKMSLYDTVSPFTSWSVECESDIAKMRLQNVKAANQATYNAPPGYIINKLVEAAVAGDIDWRGTTEYGYIPTGEGANVQYTISSVDMYTQFITLANLCGFDWRTRNNWIKYAYGVSGYDPTAKTVTVLGTGPYTSSDFVGRWLLFVSATDQGGAVNNTGIKAYGKISGNTTTVITMSAITNASTAPVSSDDVIILGNPVLDFSIDLRQPTYVSTFTMNKARVSTLQNGYEMNDMSDFKTIITKAIAKGNAIGKSAYSYTLNALNNTFSLSMAAKDEYDPVTMFPKHSSFLTFQSDAYVYSYETSGVAIVLIGQNLAIQAGDTFWVWGIHTDGTTQIYGSRTVDSVTTQVQSDGTPTTTVNFTTYLDTQPLQKYSIFVNSKTYVKALPSTSLPATWNIGIEQRQYQSSGTDAVYGLYVAITNYSQAGYNSTIVYPHLAGCLISTSINSETDPEEYSPIDYFGLISQTLTADQQITPPILEVYATNYLLNHSFYYRKGSFWAFVYDWFKADIRPIRQVSEAGWIKEGDEICILQNTADTPTDTQYGQYKNQWQVVGWTLDADQMIVTAELGDHERNTNTLINDKTSGINYTIT